MILTQGQVTGATTTRRGHAPAWTAEGVGPHGTLMTVRTPRTKADHRTHLRSLVFRRCTHADICLVAFREALGTR